MTVRCAHFCLLLCLLFPITNAKLSGQSSVTNSQVTPQPTPTGTPQPAPTAAPQPIQNPPQSAQTEVTKDKQKLDSLEQDAKVQASSQDQKLADLQKKLADLQDKLAKLPAGGDVKALTDRVIALEKLQAAQQDLIANQNKQTISDLKRQYQAGYALLSLMDDQAHRLDFAYQLGASTSAFQDAVNPINNTKFQNDVNALLSRQSPGKTIASITANPNIQKFASNPYVALGLSLASYFTSKSAQKEQQLAEISCIVNLGTSSVSATQQVQTQLAAVTANAKKFQEASSAAFRAYTKLINYSKDIDTYRKDQKDSAVDLLADLVTNSFKDGGSATTASGISNVRYQIEQVKNQLAQYDNLVQQSADFLSKFNSILADQTKAFHESACAPDASDKLAVLQDSVSKLKPAFDSGNWDISASQRALILGIPVPQ
jgi:hypothetical protein